MKRFISRHFWLSFLFCGILGAVMAGGTVMAATSWQPTSLTSVVGTITITNPPVTPNYSYTLGASVVTFPATSVDTLHSIQIHSAPITIVNTGNQPIHGINITMNNAPTGMTGASLSIQVVTSDGTGQPTSFNVYLQSNPIGTAGSIDLSTMTCTITPY